MFATSQPDLEFVRQDQHVRVLTEHHDRIRPRDLSKFLSYSYGDNTFKIFLKRNIYIIYVKQEPGSEEPNHLPTAEAGRAIRPGEQTSKMLESQDYRQRLKDVGLAENILKMTRMARIEA